MNRPELQKPLLQSALVLLAVFILIGFVAGSNAESFLGGIASIFKGIFLTILFAIGLIIALIFSIVVLFAIFLGAIAIYSPDTSRDMYYALRNRTTELLSPWWSRLPASDRVMKKTARQPKTDAAETFTRKEIRTSEPSNEPDTLELLNKTRAELSNEINGISKDISYLSKENQNLSNTVSQLKETVNEIPLDQVTSITARLEDKQEELAASLSGCLQKLHQISSSLENSDETIQQQGDQLKDAHEKIGLLSAEIAELRTTSVPSGEQEKEGHRIFSYLENDNDKRQFADLIGEAVEKDMTYTEIDDFLSQSLPENLDTIIKEHPVLTKEYIRERRQK